MVSELAGKASLLAKAKSLGSDLEAAGVDVQAVLDDIKAREAAGFTYEVADGSLGLLLMRHLRLYARRRSRWRASASSWTIARTRSPGLKTPCPRPR